MELYQENRQYGIHSGVCSSPNHGRNLGSAESPSQECLPPRSWWPCRELVAVVASWSTLLLLSTRLVAAAPLMWNRLQPLQLQFIYRVKKTLKSRAERKLEVRRRLTEEEEEEEDLRLKTRNTTYYQCQMQKEKKELAAKVEN